MQNLPPGVQQELGRLQSLAEQIEIIVQQKLALEASIKEKENCIKELEAMDDNAVVYRQIGGVLIKKDRATVLEQLKDEKLTLELRKKTLEKNEESLKQRLKEMETSLRRKLGAPQ